MYFPQQEPLVKKVKHVLDVFIRSEAKIRPHFHLTGPSGSGKSYLMHQLATQAGIPFLELNAAQITSEGMAGNSLSKALRPLRQHWNDPNIIFVDEFDKLFLRNGETTEGFRSAVQDEFLTALESKYASVFTDFGKYERVVVNNSLFIFAGAYSNQKIATIQELKDAGLRNEFVGRVPLVMSTEEVSLQDLANHLKHVKLFRDYLDIFPDQAPKTATKAIIEKLAQQSKDSNIGIRLLNSCIHQHFMGDA